MVETATEDFFGSKPQPGFQILLIWVEPVAGEIDGSAFFDVAKTATVVGEDGSETSAYTGGLVSGQLVIGFTPPAGVHEFELHWGDNPPVTLNVSP